MNDYRYTPFNIISVIIGLISLFLFLRLFGEIHNLNDLWDIIFSGFIFYPILAIVLWSSDYYFQKSKPSFNYIFLEFILSIIILIYFAKGLSNF